MQFSSNFCKQLNVIFITINYDLQSYSWWKDIISVKLIVKANKNKKIQEKQKIHPSLTAIKYNITTNCTIPTSDSYSFKNRRVIRKGNNGSKGTQQKWQFWQWPQAPVRAYNNLMAKGGFVSSNLVIRVAMKYFCSKAWGWIKAEDSSERWDSLLSHEVFIKNTKIFTMLEFSKLVF